MIKKLKLIGLAVILLQGLGMIHSGVEAGYVRQIGYYGYNPYSQSVDIQITKNGTFLSMTAGNTKKLFVLKDGNNDKSYFIRGYNGVPYYYGYFGIQGSSNDYYGTTQGRLNKYFTCDEIIPNVNENTTNCVEHTIDNNTKQILGNFLKTVTNNDYFLIDTSISHSYNSNIGYKNDKLCISSNNAGNSICFYAGASIGRIQANAYSKYIDTNNNLQFGSNLDRLTIDNVYIYDPPSVTINQNTTETNTIPICPTINQLINTYGNDYNENLCYSSSLIYSGGQITQITPKTIFELWNNYEGFTQDINLYNNYCNNATNQTACQTAFNGKDIEYTLIAKIPNTIKPNNLRQYCHLQLDYPDKNATTCVTSGTNQTGGNSIGTVPITNEDIIKGIVDGNVAIITPGNTTINQSGNTEGTSIWSDIINNEEISRNIIESLQSVYSKITGIFNKREGVSGIIPDYITRIILLIVLFKIFKK